MTFEELMQKLSEQREAAKPKPQGTAEQIFSLIGAAAPIVAGALMGGGEGAAIGAGVGSQSLQKAAADREAKQREIDKYNQDTASSMEGMMLKDFFQKQQAQAAQQLAQNKMNFQSEEASKARKETADAAMERERYRAGSNERVAGIKASAKGDKPSKGQEEFDKKSADILSAWSTGGGYSTLMSDLNKIQTQVADSLKGGDKSRNPISGMLVGGKLGSIVSPERTNLIENLHSVVQKTLRQTLGAQFTEKEGTAMLNRAFNPQLSDAENLKRVVSLIDDMKARVETTNQAFEYFKKNGTLSGFDFPTVGVTPGQEGKEETKIINGHSYRKTSGGWELIE